MMMRIMFMHVYMGVCDRSENRNVTEDHSFWLCVAHCSPAMLETSPTYTSEERARDGRAEAPAERHL